METLLIIVVILYVFFWFYDPEEKDDLRYNTQKRRKIIHNYIADYLADKSTIQASEWLKLKNMTNKKELRDYSRELVKPELLYWEAYDNYETWCHTNKLPLGKLGGYKNPKFGKAAMLIRHFNHISHRIEHIMYAFLSKRKRYNGVLYINVGIREKCEKRKSAIISHYQFIENEMKKRKVLDLYDLMEPIFLVEEILSIVGKDRLTECTYTIKIDKDVKLVVPEELEMLYDPYV